MKLSAVLAADLAMLTEALAEPGTDIEQTLHRLALDIAAVTTSFAGLTAAVDVGEVPTTITTLVDSVAPAEVVTSLRIPVSDRAHLVLYASRAGAFVDLAADLGWLTGQPAGAFVLDADVPGLAALLAVDGVGDDRAIDQASGVLIAAGHTPEEADARLDELARQDGGSRVKAARLILAALDATAADESAE